MNEYNQLLKNIPKKRNRFIEILKAIGIFLVIFILILLVVVLHSDVYSHISQCSAMNNSCVGLMGSEVKTCIVYFFLAIALLICDPMALKGIIQYWIKKFSDVKQ